MASAVGATPQVSLALPLLVHRVNLPQALRLVRHPIHSVFHLYPLGTVALAQQKMANTVTDQGQFAWSEQLRSRAESSVSGPRPSFSFANGFGNSPPRGGNGPPQDRAKSVAEMPAPPAQSPPPAKPKQPERRKPDAFQERILKGDFYMD